MKAGLGIGGEYGEGVLYESGQGQRLLQRGLGLGRLPARRAVAFRHHHVHDAGSAAFVPRDEGLEGGVDGSVAIITVGVGGSIDTQRITSPVIGFVLDPKGLMYNLTLEGSKISRIRK